MNLNWLQSIVYGLVSGLAEFLPVSSQAHRSLMLLIFGAGEETALLRFVVHFSALIALTLSRRGQWEYILRERALRRTPKRRRARMPNQQALLEWKLLTRILPWTLIGLVFYLKLLPTAGSLAVLSVCLLCNALILAIPSRIAAGDKDSRNMTPVDGIVIGLAGAISVVPGISPIGVTASAASVRGLGRAYAVDFCLLLLIPFMALLCALDAAALVSAGFGAITLGSVICLLIAFVFSFIGAYIGTELLRRIVIRSDMRQFSYYCLGLSLFSFILYLTV